MNQIKAIDTIYNGYKFRSRLEARWAIFFDTLKIPYDYESEGFDLGEAGWYLPDFWLPRQKQWVEIKPRNQWWWCTKCEELSKSKGGVLYVAGNPWPGEYGICKYESGDCSGSDPYYFGLGRKISSELWLVSNEGIAICLNPIGEDNKYPLTDCDELKNAYQAARQARFEHGERS